MPRIAAITLSTLALVASAASLHAGPTSPPIGPIAPTMKTLTEVQPRIAVNAANTPADAFALYVISQPGSYYLTGNISVPAGKGGIRITAPGVNLDLAGFAIIGQPGSSIGVYGDLNSGHAHVHDGSISSMGSNGLFMTNSFGSLFRNMLIDSCGDHGIAVGADCVIENCAASFCKYGINPAQRCILRGCSASGNTDSGFGLNAGCIAEHCIAANNPGIGFATLGAASLRGCGAVSNGSDGFNLADNNSLLDCTADSNAGNGVLSTAHAHIERCTFTHNVAHGVSVGSESRVIGNLCSRNGYTAPGSGAGIYCAPAVGRVQIESNTCLSNDFGIKVDAAPNLVLGNRCSLNTSNFEIVAGNRVGAIIVPPISGAVTGNTGGASPAADPFANLAY